MSPLEYPRIGVRLVESLAETLLDGRSVAVLGGRNVGKRFLVRRLYGELLGRGAEVGVAAFLDDAEENAPHGTGTDRFLRGVDCLPREPESILGWWRARRDAPADRPPALLLANLDSLSDHERDTLLTVLRDAGVTSLLATAEARGAEICCGPKAVWPFHRRLIVSGFEREEFDEFVRKYLDQIKLATRLSIDDISEDLYKRTGGNIYFLRVLLWATFDRWASAEGSEADALDPIALPDQAIAAQVPWNHYLRYVTRLIGHRPDVWERLRTLLKLGFVDADSDVPDLLELTGITVRQDNHLTLPGGLLSGFLKHHYNDQKFADLHAGVGDWARAFDLLDEMGENRQPRPSGVDDVADTGFMVKRLVASLHEEVVRGPERLRDWFEDGCRLLLGFPEVAYWVRGPARDAPWTERRTQEPAPDWLAPILAGRPSPTSRRGGVFLYPVPAEAGLSTLVARLPSEHPAQECAVAIRDDHVRRRLRDIRMEYLRELLDGFVAAYRHALLDGKRRRRSLERHQLDAAVTKILTGIGTELQTVRGAVELAARTLRETLGYSRVLVSLKTPDGTGLRGFVEDSDDPAQTLLAVAHFSLDPPDTSFHVETALRGRSIRARHAPSHPLADRDAARAAGINAGAFVPLDTGRVDPRTHRRMILGSLVVERDDGLPPDRGEFNDLIQFGRKLAGIFEQAERVQLLQETLNLQREPLAILDAGGRVRYANRPAADFIGPEYRHGWQNPEVALGVKFNSDDGHKGLSPLSQAVQTAREAFKLGNRLAITARDNGPPDAGAQAWAVLADVIKGDGDTPLGVFIEAQDLSFLHRVFHTLNGLLRSEILNPALGAGTPPTARDIECSLVDEIGRAFAAHLALGPVFHDRYDAERGRFVRVARHGAHGGGSTRIDDGPTYPADELTTLCFQPPRSPTVFHDDARRRNDGEAFYTSKGLKATARHHPAGAPEGLAPGGYWVDYPLCSGERLLGKLVFPCDEGFLPENLELLKTYANLFGGIIGTLFELTGRLETFHRERGLEKEEAAINAVSEFVHHLRQPIKPIPLMLRKLRNWAKGDPARLQVVESIGDTVTRFNRYVDLIRTVGSFEIRRTSCDLPGLVRKTLEMSVPLGRFEVLHPEREAPLACDVDEFYLTLALGELVENSRKYCPQKRWKITVSIEISDDEEGAKAIRLVFRDNGPGIASHDKKRIFDRGVVIGKGHKSGTGLGLHCVQRIVGEHGGTIHEEGEPGRGVRFVMNLPLPLRHSGVAT